MRLKNYFWFAMLLLAVLPAIGFCFEVTAHVDKTRISLEDSVFLKVEVNGGKADLDLSMIKDFKVISRGSASSYNYINGRSEKKATYQFVLIPLAQGTFTIPAIKATQKGQTAFTREIIIHVSEQAVTKGEAKAVFARSEVTDADLVVGQQAVYTLKFFTSKRLSGLGFETPPKFNGLSSKPFEKEKNYTLTLNGILYQVTQVNYIIVPAMPGKFTIDPAVLIANIMMKSKRDPRFDSFFNDSFFSSGSSKPLRVVSNPVEIEVLPVPAYQGNGKFSGLVGQFDIEAKMDQTHLKAGESATLTIQISGTGNIMDASLPEMDMDQAAFKVYDDNPVETIELTENGYTGVKIFKKAIVPVNPGTYEIKPIELTYFDVEKQTYQLVSTRPIFLDVMPSEKLQLATAPLPPEKGNSIVKQEVTIVNKDILEIKESLDSLKNYREMDPFLFIICLLIPAFLFSGVKVFAQITGRDISDEKRMQEKAKHYLRQAEKTDTQDEGFLGNLYACLGAIVLSKGKRKGEAVTIQEARTILTDATVDESQIIQITHLLETIESVRFGGRRIDENKARQLLSKTKQAMKLICLALVCSGVFFAGPQKAVANSADTFVAGIKNYRAGQFEKAAQQFETIAQNHVKNPYLFYNIANAYLKANDIGRAILWYQRAKVLLPNDPDLNFNLAYATSLVTDKKEDTLNIMEILFFWDSLLPARTIQITAIFCSFIFFAWAAIRVVKKQKVFSGTGILLCTLFVLVTAVTCVNYYKRSVHVNAVIVRAQVAVRSGMADTSTQLFSLHAGTTVRVKAQRNGYLKIMFSQGKVGWVKTGEAVII